MIPYVKEGLIDSLNVAGPHGERLALKVVPQVAPAGTFATSFNVAYYYDFTRPGQYLITASCLALSRTSAGPR